MSKKKCHTCRETADELIYCAHCGKNYCEPCYQKAHQIVTDARGEPVHAELHSAFLWDCDSCGAENILRISVKDYPNRSAVPRAQRPLVMSQLGVSDWSEVPEELRSQACSIPRIAECKHCHDKFVISLPE